MRMSTSQLASARIVAILGALLLAGPGALAAQSTDSASAGQKQAAADRQNGPGAAQGAPGAAAKEQNPSAADQPEPQRVPWLYVGPRIGVGGEIAQPSNFNDTVQRVFPSGHSYFPVYSQIGLDLSERVSLAETGYHFFFSQLLAVSGLDQNFALPSLSFLLGAMTPFGLEAALGPQLELANDGGGAYVAPSLVYAVGYRLHVGFVSIPVMLFVDPLPPNRRIRLTILAGVDYGFAPSRPKPPPAFNY